MALKLNYSSFFLWIYVWSPCLNRTLSTRINWSLCLRLWLNNGGPCAGRSSLSFSRSLTRYFFTVWTDVPERIENWEHKCQSLRHLFYILLASIFSRLHVLPYAAIFVVDAVARHSNPERQSQHRTHRATVSDLRSWRNLALYAEFVQIAYVRAVNLSTDLK